MAKFIVSEKFEKPKPKSPALIKALQTVVPIPKCVTEHLRIRPAK